VTAFDRPGLPWAFFASLIVLAALSAVVWWLVGGCETTPRTASDPDNVSASDTTLAVIQKMTDPNVAEFAFQVAAFYAAHRRLPATAGEMPPQVASDSPPLPAATARSTPIAYRPTGDLPDGRQSGRAFELILSGPDATGCIIPLEVPADLPAQMNLPALRAWWDLWYVRRMAEMMKTGLAPAHTGRTAEPSR